MFLEDALEAKLNDLLPIVQQRLLHKTRYFGVPTVKHPCDLWVYQEIITTLKPEVIIEIGNYCGGTTLALAHICDLLNVGKVIGIDVNHANIQPVVRAHPRIVLLEGNACALVDKVKSVIQAKTNILIIEDSSHHYDNTLSILRTYKALIPLDGYFIIEDSICHHGLNEGPNPGPFEAVETFLTENKDFVSDRTREDFIMTWNPKGFLKRIGVN